MRRLVDSRVGEYKSNLIINLITYSIVIVGAICLFLFPLIMFETTLETGAMIIERYSPIAFLLSGYEQSLYRNCCSLYVILFGYALVNMFLCIGIKELGRGKYFKVSKALEGTLAFVCLIYNAYCFITQEISYPYEGIKYFYFWGSFAIVITLLVMISFFTTKKISIYD